MSGPDVDGRSTVRGRPAGVSLALGDPGDLVDRAHAVGARFMQQVDTVEQAERAAERGADVLVAQGAEALHHAGRLTGNLR